MSNNNNDGETNNTKGSGDDNGEPAIIAKPSNEDATPPTDLHANHCENTKRRFEKKSNM